MKKLFGFILVLAFSASLLMGCGAPASNATQEQQAHLRKSAQAEIQSELLSGGVLCLKINPEIALHYDENGKVTKLEGRNPEGIVLLQNFTGYIGKETSQVLEELVQIIGQAGYFEEEAEGKARKIVLELDPGSRVPHEKFLEDMAAHVKACVESKTWSGDREYDYQASVPQQTTASAAPKPAAPGTTASVPAGLCPVCADDDCDDGRYCDDSHEKAENLKEYERRLNGEVCPVCTDDDCDDGKHCDDWNDRYDHDKHHDD